MPFASNSPALMNYLFEFQISNYLAVSLLTVVFYDYILKLDREISLIWVRT
ncbi:hypothetical protein CONPUDRAFT_149589 [Coniophora puteana RWD-64-598 SS2]|uniref:DUF6533 domain-containing protein n=1 Tax=Coniophora puteana (strain RWD-64-598) TaxID=741705 RepID=A0A5M3N004_CONPW|nr:uncharacterized protein CONPUDRAFT_149589 [Coniophora puteana RWD-64-598 SS2]EIW84720.1 hypothetical protein CONPUDRAFT_149589 [Coniophora puteana RWD-64-598 SS2]